MIPFKELRIGNLVTLDGFVQPIQVINAYKGHLCFANAMGNFENDSDDKSIQPIALTDEILLKCGFDSGILKAGNLFLQQFDDDKGFVFITGDADDPLNDKPVQYLHQLQNLYFALTGEELNIEL
jgi:hypothetical protein